MRFKSLALCLIFSSIVVLQLKSAAGVYARRYARSKDTIRCCDDLSMKDKRDLMAIRIAFAKESGDRFYRDVQGEVQSVSSGVKLLLERPSSAPPGIVRPLAIRPASLFNRPSSATHSCLRLKLAPVGMKTVSFNGWVEREPVRGFLGKKKPLLTADSFLPFIEECEEIVDAEE